MRRRLLLSLAGLMAVVLIAAFSVPFWFGAAMRAAGASHGVHFRSYERLGYGRFAFHQVEVRRGNVTVTASRVEANSPLIWGWHRISGRPNFVTADEWAVTVTRSAPPRVGAPTTPETPAAAPPPTSAGAAPVAAKPGPTGWAPLHATLRKVAAQLAGWLPAAQVGHGTVRFPGGEISVRAATWRDRELFVEEADYRALAVTGKIQFPTDADAIRAQIQTIDHAGSLKAESRGTTVTSAIEWWGQPATVQAEFDHVRWMPREAHLAAARWSIPGARLRLGESYARVAGDARIDWANGRLAADLTAKGEPVAGKSAPPLEVVLHGTGDTQAFTLESFAIALPGITGRLSAPVTIDRTGKFRGPAAVFALEANLARQPWFAAQGTASGEARLASGINQLPLIDFHVAARDVSAHGIAVKAFDSQGRFAWPSLEISEATLTGESGEAVHAAGEWDFRGKALRKVTVRGELRRTSLARWLPAKPEFERVTLDLTASGPLAAIEHTGHLQAEAVRWAPLNPLRVNADWRGRGTTIDSLNVRASNAGTTLTLAGSVTMDHARIDQLAFSTEGAERLRLIQPAEIHWARAGADPAGAILTLPSLQLAGPEASIVAALEWGRSGRVEIAAKKISSGWFKGLMPAKGPVFTLGSLAVTGSWKNAPMTFSISGDVAFDLGEGRKAAVAIAGRGDASGMRIDALRAVEGEKTVLNATGRVPIMVQPAATPLVRIDPKGALALDASTAPHADFWRELTQLTGIELGEPDAAAHLKGTWERPEGEITVKAARLTVDPRRFARPLPEIEALDFHAFGDRSGVQIDRCSVRVEGQEIRASGHLPVQNGGWAAWMKSPLDALERDAQAHVEVPDADIPAFARFLPATLAPQGRLQLDLEYHGGGLAGQLRLRGAASRPIGPLGVLQEINADVRLDGRTLRLENVSAKAGGQPLTITGTVDLPPLNRTAFRATPNTSWIPRFNIAARGANLPFVREAGLLLRGDLDLKLQTPEAAAGAAAPAPRISGKVTLRDSLFLSDVRAFMPKGGTASPARRPPYFSITTPPLNQWTLAVELSGDRFLRLRTAVFNGLASAHFRLGGTLSEPRAIGDVTIDDGQVLMPFATFDVRQAAVRLTEADPFEPTIYLRGTTRRFGYDIAMEIDGRASAPNMVFTSSPALDSEQVLLMVMTGAVPSNDIATSGTQRFASVGRYLGQSLIGSLMGSSSGADRLTISSGEKISHQGKETYDIEYKLNDRWTAVGEYNEFDEYTAGLKWRVLPRKSEHDADNKPAEVAGAVK